MLGLYSFYVVLNLTYTGEPVYKFLVPDSAFSAVGLQFFDRLHHKKNENIIQLGHDKWFIENHSRAFVNVLFDFRECEQPLVTYSLYFTSMLVISQSIVQCDAQVFARVAS